MLLLAENGFIEDEELDGFLREFVSSVNAEEDLEVCKQLQKAHFANFLQEVTEETLAELKACFWRLMLTTRMERLNIREVRQIIVKGVPKNITVKFGFTISEFNSIETLTFLALPHIIDKVL